MVLVVAEEPDGVVRRVPLRNGAVSSDVQAAQLAAAEILQDPFTGVGLGSPSAHELADYLEVHS
jgi:hypothetical protein